MATGRRNPILKIARVAAVSIYWIVTRLALLAALLFASLYFVLNSGPFPERLTALLKAALPGTLEFGTIQVSPIPWRVDVLDVRISTPAGEEVVSAGTVQVSVDLVPLVALLVGEEKNVILHFKSIRLIDFDTTIAFDQDGNLHFLDAFVWPPEPEPEAPPEGGGGPSVVLAFPRITGERGRATVAFPEWDLRVENVSLDAEISLDAHGRIRVASPDLTFAGGLARVRAAPGVERIPRELRLDSGHVTGFVFDTDRISVGHARVSTPEMLVDTSGRLAFPSDGPLDYEGVADLVLVPGSRLVETATAGLVSGPLTLHVEGSGDESDPRFSLSLASPALSVNGVAMGETRVAVAGGRDGPAPYAFTGISAEFHPGGGRVTVDGGSVKPFGDAFEAAANATLDAVDVAAVLGALGIPLPPPAAPVPVAVTGRLDASVRIGGDGISITHEVALRGPLPPRTALAGRDLSVRAAGATSLAAGAALPVVRLSELAVRSGGDSVRGRGTVDLERGTLDVSASVEASLAPLSAALGARIEGTVSMTDLKATGALGRPDVRASVRASGLAAGGWTVEEVAGSLSLHAGEIALSDVIAKTPFAAITAGRVAVGIGDLARRNERFRGKLALRGLRLQGLDLAQFPPTRAMQMRGRGDVEFEEAEARLDDPLATLSGSGRAQFATIAALGKTWTRVEADVAAEGGRVTVRGVSAGLRGGGSVRASGRVELADGRVELEVKASGVPAWVVAGTSATGPLQGTLDGEVALRGRLDDPAVEARVETKALAYGDLKVGTVTLSAAREAGTDLRLSSERFLPKLSLNPESRVTWERGAFTGLVIMVDANRFTLQDAVPSIRSRDVTGQLTGNVQVRIGFGPEGRLTASVTSPPGGLALRFFNREVALVSEEKLVAAILPDGTVTVTGLALSDGRERIEACGEVLDASGRSRLLVRGAIGLYWLRAFKELFSSAHGYLRLAANRDAPATGPQPRGCDESMEWGEGSLLVTGTFAQPAITGTVTSGDVEVLVRRYPDAIRMEPGTRVTLAALPDGRTDVAIGSAGLRGAVGDGSFVLKGRASFAGLVPDAGFVQISGTGLRFVSPGQFYFVADPDLSATFHGFANPDRAAVAVGGQVAITDGSYHRNFDVVRKAFSSVTGERVAEREGPSLASLSAWLANTALDVAVTGTRFGVRSRLPVGSTDLDLAMDLRVKGTVGRPELWNRVEVIPGGKVVYEVVHREFEVQRGTLDFRGEPGRPLADLTARARVDYRGATSAPALIGSHAPDTGTDAFSEDTILVTLRVSGPYPDLDISLSSNATDLDQTDLQYLLLTGMTRSTLGQAGGKGVDLGLLTEDVSNAVTRLLLAPFVDTVRFGVSSTGGVNAEVAAHMGSRLKFETQVLQEQGGSRYTAGFQVKLTDRLSLDGRIRAIEQSLANPTQPTRVFESKLRYRIPLD